ncbi:hypothetical protein ACE38W_00595 [Chitinophaga sp. Hz27]|uniref:hypothetical protein n=1 Tax=Chitinophaga sp. Hz27 TaxID=3347169 RepID=UPI0035DE26B4
MKERPILFSTDMVRALLAGKKTQTRRLTGLELMNEAPNSWASIGIKSDNGILKQVFFKNGKYTAVKCPYGEPGDILWVRERFARYEKVPMYGSISGYLYADGTQNYPSDALVLPGNGYIPYAVKWRPSIHMPKEAARIYLQVTDRRVDRIQDIIENDAIAEGINEVMGGYQNYTALYRDALNPIHSFKSLIEKIHGKELWLQNPWVWVVSFRMLSTTGKPDKFPLLCEVL